MYIKAHRKRSQRINTQVIILGAGVIAFSYFCFTVFFFFLRGRECRQGGGGGAEEEGERKNLKHDDRSHDPGIVT